MYKFILNYEKITYDFLISCYKYLLKNMYK